MTAVFTPSTRRELARTNPKSPLTAARRVAHHIDIALTTENLAAECGISAEAADDIFWWSDRLRLSLRKDPIKMLRRIVRNYEFLGTENLSLLLGWSEIDVSELFTVGARHRLARYTGNLSAYVKERARVFKEDVSIQNIARNLGWSEARATRTFTSSVRRNIAMGNVRDPLARVVEVATVQAALAERYIDLPADIVTQLSARFSRSNALYAAGVVQREQFNNPKGIGRKTWLWAVANDPHAMRAQWVKNANAYTLFLRILSPLSINNRMAEDGTTGDYSDIPVAGFEEDLFSDQPSDYLQALALKAGISYAQLEVLLREYTTESQALTPAAEAALHRLRIAAQRSN